MKKIKKQEKKKGSFYSEVAKQGEDFLRYWEEKRKLVDKSLEGYLPRGAPSPEVLSRAMYYALFPGGKRLRAILTLTASEVLGGDIEKTLPAACALELIHTYSLIHDDLPALDDDDLRRGKPSLHKAYGEDVAVLAGDAFLTLSFALVSQVQKEEGREKIALRVINEIAKAIGTEGMIGGQMDDLRLERGVVSLKGLDSVNLRKTGALIEVSLRVGAISAGGGEKEINVLSRYGQKIGLAFQITDDMLDVLKEKKKGKITYPALIGLEKSGKRAAELIAEAKQELSSLGGDGKFLEAVAGLILSRIES